jgi:hypothetical protein
MLGDESPWRRGAPQLDLKRSDVVLKLTELGLRLILPETFAKCLLKCPSVIFKKVPHVPYEFLGREFPILSPTLSIHRPRVCRSNP